MRFLVLVTLSSISCATTMAQHAIIPSKDTTAAQQPITEEAPVVAITGPAPTLYNGNRPKAAYMLALRSNLLFDIAGAPNIGVEIMIGTKFSIAADAAYAYWHINRTYALQTIQGGIEGRYWFRLTDGKPLTGWSAGVYGMYSSRYDVQWNGGYQGDGFWSAGISAGYSMPIAKRLNLEFAIAAGYFFTPEVRHYHRGQGGRLMWQQTRYNVGRVSLTKVKVNLIWLLGKKGTTNAL